MMRALLVGLITHALAANAAHGQEPLLAELKGVKNLKISLGANVAEPSVRMLCGEIGIERARVGFLRVGLLRFPVIRDMKLQLAEGSTTWASDLWAYAQQEEWLRHAEIRGLTIIASENQMLLRAESAKLNGSLAVEGIPAESALEESLAEAALSGARIEVASPLPGTLWAAVTQTKAANSCDCKKRAG